MGSSPRFWTPHQLESAPDGCHVLKGVKTSLTLLCAALMQRSITSNSVGVGRPNMIPQNLVLFHAGFSWQIHAEALKTVQAFVSKVQDAQASLPSQSQSPVNELVPGMSRLRQLWVLAAQCLSALAAQLGRIKPEPLIS